MEDKYLSKAKRISDGECKEGLNPRLFYVGFNAWVSAIEIGGRYFEVFL